MDTKPSHRSLAAILATVLLAGKSKMEGQAAISTFVYIGDDPATAPLMKMMRWQ
jgi:hypothetical protein